MQRSLACLLLTGGAIAAAPGLATGFPTTTELSAKPSPSAACLPQSRCTVKVSGELWPLSPLGLVVLADNGAPLGTILLTPPQLRLRPRAYRRRGLRPHEPHLRHAHRGALGGDASDHGQLRRWHRASRARMASLRPSPQRRRPTSLSSSANPSVYGQPVSFDSDVSSSCSGSVAGTVQLHADGV